MEAPPTQFVTTRKGRIAFQDYGQEAPVVVAIPPMAQNVEEAWQRPEIKAMLERFGSFARWIQFDKRGTGASDRRSHTPGIDERVDDLRAVMDGAGVERAFLYGASEGGPTCVLFAVTYPERVEGLILHGTGPFTAPQDLTETERARFIEGSERIADLWGTPDSPIAEHFAPSLAHDPTFVEWHQRYERMAADRASYLELLQISLDVDVREVLPHVDTPTLILHRTGDPIIPVEWARQLAEGIAGSTLIEAEGADHFSYVGEQDWLDHVERFVTGSVTHRPSSLRQRSTHIRAFGAFEVEVDGLAIPQSEWGSRKARLLCMRLVAARGWPVRREELFDMLWPDENDITKLGARLSVQLSHVRRVLGGGVVADRLTVALDLDAVTTDLEIVLGSRRPDRIVEAYRGELFAADLHEDWTTTIRDEARGAFIAAARELAQHAVALPREAAARSIDVMALADRIIAVDPYDEAGYRIAIESCGQTDDRAAARRVHARWNEAMQDLGLDAPPFDDVFDSPSQRSSGN